MAEFSRKEMEAIVENELRQSQLRNIRTVMNGSITPKKLKHMEQNVLPGYVVRATNAMSAAKKIMSKKGYRYNG